MSTLYPDKNTRSRKGIGCFCQIIRETNQTRSPQSDPLSRPDRNPDETPISSEQAAYPSWDRAFSSSYRAIYFLAERSQETSFSMSLQTSTSQASRFQR